MLISINISAPFIGKNLETSACMTHYRVAVNVKQTVNQMVSGVHLSFQE